VLRLSQLNSRNGRTAYILDISNTADSVGAFRVAFVATADVFCFVQVFEFGTLNDSQKFGYKYARLSLVILC
jgi:hypothetical protein